MKSILLTLCCVVSLSTLTNAANFGLDPSNGKDTVYFRSTAKLEFIEGKTNVIDGHFTFDPTHVDQAITGLLRVDLRTLKTGIDMRDQHMRERHLQTDDYPYAYFEIGKVTGIPSVLKPNSTDSGTVDGWFYIHGVKRKLTASIFVSLAEEPGREKVTIRTKFQIILDEYGIPRPKALLMKLAERIDVECIFSAYNNLPGFNFDLPAWPARD